MSKFVYLFKGGNVPTELREQNMKDWMSWLGKLQAEGVLADMGAPLDTGVVLHNDGTAHDFTWENDSCIGGFSVIEVSDIETAKGLLEGCPQLDPQYGDGSVEVRPMMDVSM